MGTEEVVVGIAGADVVTLGGTVELVVEVVSADRRRSEVGGVTLVALSDEIVVLGSPHAVTNRIDTAPNTSSRGRRRRLGLDIGPVNQGAAGIGRRGQLVGWAF